MLTKYSAVSEQRQSSRPSRAAIRRIRARRSANEALVRFLHDRRFPLQVDVTCSARRRRMTAFSARTKPLAR